MQFEMFVVFIIMLTKCILFRLSSSSSSSSLLFFKIYFSLNFFIRIFFQSSNIFCRFYSFLAFNSFSHFFIELYRANDWLKWLNVVMNNEIGWMRIFTIYIVYIRICWARMNECLYGIKKKMIMYMYMFFCQRNFEAKEC